MNHDEPYFKEKLQRFSVVKACPRCNKLSLAAKDNSIYCSNCGYQENIPMVK